MNGVPSKHCSATGFIVGSGSDAIVSLRVIEHPLESTTTISQFVLIEGSKFSTLLDPKSPTAGIKPGAPAAYW
ncbi:MAG: hypothetical protein TRG1_3537 [Flavobacteriaceae bacterium FS1-H7996/R]|nr:MAG: hypothetical protein TRG1_3537 [Flavobacteriaceae bacterium FS1-H7996/R]